MKFAKLFEFENDMQVLVVRSLPPAKETIGAIYSLSESLYFKDVRGTLEHEFDSMQSRDLAFDSYDQNRAKILLLRMEITINDNTNSGRIDQTDFTQN